MHPLSQLRANPVKPFLPLSIISYQPRGAEQSRSCSSSWILLQDPALPGDTATPRSPPRPEPCRQMRSGQLLAGRCFQRSHLTHEKCSSSPAGKERKKAQHCPPAMLRATSTGQPSPASLPCHPPGQTLLSIKLGCSLMCSAVLGPAMPLEPLCKEMATCKKHQAGKGTRGLAWLQQSWIC